MKKETVEHIQEYLVRMAEIRGTGGATKETSYYSALENLLNYFGGELRPAVICNGQLRNQGAGSPDFGLYTKSQIQNGEPRPGQKPERGVVEVKGLADHTWQTAKSNQATKYFELYRLVLITNYREFRLIGEDDENHAVELDAFSLADSEVEFWKLAGAPSLLSESQTVHFTEFLKRVLMTAAPLKRAEDVAWFLASYARDALQIIEGRKSDALDPLRSALEIALGIRFEGVEGQHFFRSTLVQTLFYGVFSSWVVFVREHSTAFDWKSAAYTLTVPMVRALFEQIATPSKLGALGLMPLLDRTADALNRVDKESFFKSFDSGEAVQHFYEPFLEAFDPELRKNLGVWYTPREIVDYMIERVDQLLRTELNRPNGLADQNVYVLDPCCGTGTYVVAALKRIERTLREQGADALLGEDLKQAAMERIYGFELMSAPFVIAHWQVGHYLSQLGAPLNAATGERPGIYLTNALTGWEPPKGPKAHLPLFPELEHERDAAEHVKREVPILVVLGNPPYNAFAGTSPAEEAGLVEVYKEGLSKNWGVKKYNLDDLYVRFFRIAERRISQLGQGIVAYISNHSYIGDTSYVVARRKLLTEFDSIWIDDLNGDSRETGKKTPDGLPDPSVFSTKYNREGIRVGTSIGFFVRRADRSTKATVKFRQFWGAKKRLELLESLQNANFENQYEEAVPEAYNKFSFRPHEVLSNYKAWPSLPLLARIAPLNGLMEKRGGALIDLDRSALEKRMTIYFNEGVTWTELAETGNPLTHDAARYEPEKTRKRLIHDEGFRPERIVRYFVRPFDFRYCYYSGIRPLWNEPRPDLWALTNLPKNGFLVSRPASVSTPEGPPFYFTSSLGDNDALRGHAYYFPVQGQSHEGDLLGATQFANLSERARGYLQSIGSATSDYGSATLIWLHVLAIGFSPAYLAEQKAGLAIEWPRIPMPATSEDLSKSAELGKKIAALLQPDSSIVGVTEGDIAPHLRVLGLLSAPDLSLNAGWGRLDRKGKVFPGRGRIIERQYSKVEIEAFKDLTSLKMNADRALDLLGPSVDVFLNDATCWKCIPRAVWEYFIGGYQPIKKWLSYREQAVLGRPLTKEEARYVTGMVRRLATLVLLSDDLDANYVSSKQNAYPWPSDSETNLGQQDEAEVVVEGDAFS